MSNSLNRVTARYPYVHPDRPEEIALWQMRLERVDGSRFDGDKTKQILYRRPSAPGNNDPYLALCGKPPGDLADRCLFGLSGLRRGLAAGVRAVFWTEGEKDCRAADELLCDADLAVEFSPLHWTGVAVSHHGGAGQATPQQAEHFRGYRGRVYVAVDWDDAGAACALRRRELLRALGVRTKLVRPADGALRYPALPPAARGGGRGLSARERFELEVWARADGLPSRPSGGADLTDHLAAGYALRDLVPVRRADLAAAAHEAQSRWARGGSSDGYGAWAGWAGSAWEAGTGVRAEADAGRVADPGRSSSADYTPDAQHFPCRTALMKRYSNLADH